MKFAAISELVPNWRNALLALLSAGLLVLAFPPFELWFTAWVALVPLLWAVEREKERGHSCPHEPEGRKQPFRTLLRSWGREFPRSFVLGWLFGNVFFFGTCWWLTFAPITYAGFPAPLAYFLLFCVTSLAAIFPGLFAAITAFLLRRFGSIAFLAGPFIWVFTEFLRYWLTGNNWNALGYSQAFSGKGSSLAAFGGTSIVGWLILVPVCVWTAIILSWNRLLNNRNFYQAFEFFRKGHSAHLWPRTPDVKKAQRDMWTKPVDKMVPVYFVTIALFALGSFGFLIYILTPESYVGNVVPRGQAAQIVALQPSVPMSGLTIERWSEFRRRHMQLAESALSKLNDEEFSNRDVPRTVIFPESPMNFMYEDDAETKEFINGFAKRNNVSVLFNSAEPDTSNGKFFNSAVLVGPEGRETAQYDKIYLLPFGEAVPFPLEGILPGFVGNFSYGREYDLLPLGEAKAGVMICFESHFGQLSREYVRNGADAIIEMTNDGYLGPTPVLRQHLANAVFRAVETNRPVLRVTNVGITAYINERGEVLDAAESYVEATRVWSVAKSDGSQTFYVKYGDWFAWLCTLVTFGLLGLAILRKKRVSRIGIRNKE